jgi:ethanolamine permease
VISHAAVQFTFLKLRLLRPDLERPYRSPFGIPGAFIGGVLAVLSLTATLAVEDYRPGVYGVAIIVIVTVLYFALYRRERLVADSPEAHAALTEEQHVAYDMDAD